MSAEKADTMTRAEEKKNYVVLSSDQFDLESYIVNYSGRTRINRLFFIADKIASKEGQKDALKLAVEETRKGVDTSLYFEAIAKARELSGDEVRLDSEWSSALDRQSLLRKEKLEEELNGYRTNLIKESIRMALNDLGDFFYATGDLNNAFKSYVRTRDYCTASKHVVDMCLAVILVSAELSQFSTVLNYAQKAESTPDSCTDGVMQSKIKTSCGVAFLDQKKYKMAARKFVETSFELGSNYSQFISPQDVATYGSLCALATFDRQELKAKIIDNLNFKNFLELVPHVREIVRDFHACRYHSCLTSLDRLLPVCQLDIHLHRHMPSLLSKIRCRALTQYTLPFLSVDLNRMTAAFGMTSPAESPGESLDESPGTGSGVAALEKELASLIMEGEIQARIDSHKKVLYARHANQRNATFHRAMAVGASYERDTKAMLLRSSLLRNEVFVRGEGKPKGPAQLSF